MIIITSIALLKLSILYIIYNITGRIDLGMQRYYNELEVARQRRIREERERRDRLAREQAEREQIKK